MLSPILLTFIFYGITICLLGYIAYKRTNNLSDYMLAGRSLNGLLAAMGAGAADMSAWLMMSLPGAVMAFGVSKTWMAIGLVIGAMFNWSLVAKRLRVYTEVAKDSLTIPTYFHNRFHETSPATKFITSSVILIFFIMYAASGFTAGAQLIESTFNIDYFTGLYISAIVIVIYTMLGGFLALNWMDLFQGSLMFCSLLIVPFVTFNNFDSLDSAFDLIRIKDSHYFNMFDDISLMEVIALLTWGLGYFGQPHILVRFMAARTHHDLSLARKIGLSWMILSLLGAIFTGIAGAAYFSNGLIRPETVFLVLSKSLFNPWAAGILLAAVLSAIMSTVSALLIACSSCITEDIYHAITKDNSNKNLVFLGRLSVIGSAIIAVFIAMNPDKTIMSLVEYAWSGLGASFGPAILFSLYWIKTSKNGIRFGMIAGALTVILWEFFPVTNPIYPIGSLLPGFIISSLTIYFITVLENEKNPYIEKEFNKTLQILEN